MKRDRFSLVFPTHVQFCTQIVVPYFLEPFNQPTFLGVNKKSPHMIIISLFTVLQVTNNRLNNPTTKCPLYDDTHKYIAS